MKTAVDAVFIGKERTFNRRFQQLMSHHLIEPTACTYDNNKYSVAASAVGRPVDVNAYADRIVIKQDGYVVGAHSRRFGRHQVAYDPWHYVRVLARKPAPCGTARRSRTGR